jgi:gamma-glutamylcyclotransferase (GGCT)/AIG2-like uncharacterized protein YtfP
MDAGDGVNAPILRVFVYGTLKRGGRFHEEFCRGALSIEEAQVRGRLDSSGPFPVLAVPETDVLAPGTGDPLADVATQERIAAFAEASDLLPPDVAGNPAAGQGLTHADWDLVPGELMSFDDPAARLPAFDRLEDFNPGGKSLYLRVLVPVRLVENGEIEVGWAWVGA